MVKNTSLLLFFMVAVTGCGGGGEDPSTTSTTTQAASGTAEPVLSPIGNKLVISGDTLSFTINASDPDNLALTYSSDGRAGTGPNPYSETASQARFNSTANSGQFSWNTSGVALGDYFVAFRVMNSASLTDSETIRIRIQAAVPAADQYQSGQVLYNADCNSSGCHHDEDRRIAYGAFSVICTTVTDVKFNTELGPGSMPGFDYTASQESDLAFYLNNVRPGDC